MERVISFSSSIKAPFSLPNEIELPRELNQLLKDGFTVKSIYQESVLKKRSNKVWFWQTLETVNEYFVMMTIILEKKDS
ncbi:MAG: hypothetical protein LLF80_01280 [Porphyromonadaceae bacterium]|nr:hypothetical protein [Porphyromonadaceae bacterium]